MEIVIKQFKELLLNELYQILQLRSEVFVVEQNCVYQDVDNKDQKALHVIGRKNDKIIAYTRVFKAGDYFNNPSIGRVVVEKHNRQYGFGKDIMLASINAIEKSNKKGPIEISAQKYLKNFYKDLGFSQVGEGYLEDGIPHVKMIKQDV